MENMNQIQVFTNNVFGDVRAINVEGKVWFVGRDAVKCLGYEVEGTTSYTYYTGKFVKEKYMLKMKNCDLQLFGMADAGRKGEVLINQNGIIQLVMNSPMEEAEKFQDWILEEVIPSVLTTGKYELPQQQKPKTQEELAKDSMFALVYNKINNTEKRLEAVQHIADYSRTLGKGEICDNGTITIPGVKNYDMKHHGNILMENNVFLSDQFIEFHRFLAYKQYLEGKRFKRKSGAGMEKKATYQPTNLFYTNFVEQGFAQVREIDNRGKLEITYTKDIEKYIASSTFKREFCQYLGIQLNELEVA